MHSRIILNNRLVDGARASLPAITPAALYGRGVFTTLAVHNGRPFLWAEHWARLTAHADRAKIDRSLLDEAQTLSQLTRLIEANEVHDGRARITLFSNSTRGGIWNLQDEGEEARGETLLLIMTGEAHAPPSDVLALTVSPYRINTLSPLVGVKSVNYLEHLISLEEARSRDFHEAVVLNERGEVVSATMANIFWVKDGALHTPALQTGALAGTTRACILRLAEELGVPVVEGVNELAQVGDADEIFLTSAGLGLAIVTTFDFHHYTVPVGSVALRLHEAFRQLTLHAE
ncbi:MAG: aminotransferase class IV family protein [Pyrinomonadaceae bacterium]|nr:aminotransferase class IV family protein [Pyrinomonadaceae bacterium]